ncbi:ATP-dependent helicase [Corynebacterium diphtheriae]|nr:hypothetical protein [Corynebacterium diphtheriae bv. gravis]CAB0932002.1 ATP-dependent helicase [Corynebacterium diphtheriae]
MQYDRVIVVLDTTGASRKRRTHAENWLTPSVDMEDHVKAQRLFYVAASRARNELVLAVDQRLKESLESFLSYNGIEFEEVKLPIEHEQ